MFDTIEQQAQVKITGQENILFLLVHFYSSISFLLLHLCLFHKQIKNLTRTLPERLNNEWQKIWLMASPLLGALEEELPNIVVVVALIGDHLCKSYWVYFCCTFLWHGSGRLPQWLTVIVSAIILILGQRRETPKREDFWPNIPLEISPAIVSLIRRKIPMTSNRSSFRSAPSMAFFFFFTWKWIATG